MFTVKTLKIEIGENPRFKISKIIDMDRVPKFKCIPH